MANPRIWLINTSQFPMLDYETGTRFEPGTPIKAELTDFVKIQPTIIRCADPNNDLSEKEHAKLQAQIDADEAERVAREQAAADAMAAANGQVVEAPAPVVVEEGVKVIGGGA